MLTNVNSNQKAVYNSNFLNVTQAAQIGANLLANRRNKYLSQVSSAVEKATEKLDSREFISVEDAGEAFKSFSEVHAVARDIFSLGKTVNSTQVQVNVLGSADIRIDDSD